MDVYLIPVGHDRYELYCEHLVPEEAISPEAPAGSSRIAAMLHRMKAAVARIEQEHQRGEPPTHDRPTGWIDRLKRRMLCWIAERCSGSCGSNPRPRCFSRTIWLAIKP